MALLNSFTLDSDNMRSTTIMLRYDYFLQEKFVFSSSAQGQPSSFPSATH